MTAACSCGGARAHGGDRHQAGNQLRPVPGQVLGHRAPSEKPTRCDRLESFGDVRREPGKRDSFGSRRPASVPRSSRTWTSYSGSRNSRRGSHIEPSSPTPWMRAIRSRLTAAGTYFVSVAKRCQALLGPSLGSGGERDHDFVGVRGVVDPDLDALVVGADGGVGDVLERDVEDDTGRAALFHCRQQRGGVGGVAEVVSEGQGVDEPGTVLDFAVQPHDGGLAVCLGRGAEGLEHAGGEQRADVGGVAVDAGGEVFDEALAGPRVLDDGGDDGDAGGRADLPASFR